MTHLLMVILDDLSCLPDLGGNATLVGAAAGVVVASLAEKSGNPIGFRRFLRYGVITTIMSLALASVYVWLRYL